MTKIAEFYGFKVFVDSSFTGEPKIFIDYEADHISGYYNIEERCFINVEFPYYLIEVIKEWIADNLALLKEMWEKRTLIAVPEWEE